MKCRDRSPVAPSLVEFRQNFVQTGDGSGPGRRSRSRQRRRREHAGPHRLAKECIGEGLAPALTKGPSFATLTAFTIGFHGADAQSREPVPPSPGERGDAFGIGSCPLQGVAGGGAETPGHTRRRWPRRGPYRTEGRAQTRHPEPMCASARTHDGRMESTVAHWAGKAVIQPFVREPSFPKTLSKIMSTCRR